jgi:predicted dehydrogenase
VARSGPCAVRHDHDETGDAGPFRACRADPSGGAHQAATRGESLTGFVLDAATRAAEHELAAERETLVPAAFFERRLAALDADGEVPTELQDLAPRPVLVEKPFTMNGAEARDLVAAARAAGVFLMEAMWTRFLPHVAAIRELLATGALGELVWVQADHGQWFAPDPASRLFAPELGGGALLDLGVYPVSFASMVLGTPSRVEVAITPAFSGVDGQTSMIFTYTGGAQALLSCCSLARTPTRAVIAGTAARLEIAPEFYAPTSFEIVERDGSRRLVDPPHEGGGHWYHAAEVARCLDAGLTESPLMPLDETVSIMETMDLVLAGGTVAASATQT